MSVGKRYRSAGAMTRLRHRTGGDAAGATVSPICASIEQNRNIVLQLSTFLWHNCLEEWREAL
jgi:hypothetical protein